MAGSLQPRIMRTLWRKDHFNVGSALNRQSFLHFPSCGEYRGVIGRKTLFTRCSAFSNMKMEQALTIYPVSASYSRHCISKPVTLLRNLPQVANSTHKFCQGFHTTQNSCQQNNDFKTPKNPTFNEQMSLRLINENGFLSWTRNSYLSAAVAVGMINGSNDDFIQNAGVFVLLVSAMNMTWGSGCHFTNLLRLQDRIAMSRLKLLLNLLGTIVHALLWIFTLGYYLQLWGGRRPQPLHQPQQLSPSSELTAVVEK